ncbi:MAG: hypothetical protein MUC80_07920 [Candidatus Thermoplasmatota archaeon]|nr:hypothetical protein [Candidatus Thermoplasmatota archaeon]
MIHIKNTIESDKKNKFYGLSIGTIFIIIGILFSFFTISFHLKLTVTFIFLGLVIILMMNEKETQYTINNIQLILILLIITLVFWLLTLDTEFEKFFIFITISIIALKELLHVFLSPYLQRRMTLLFGVLFVPLMIIFVQKIINILSSYPS